MAGLAAVRMAPDLLGLRCGMRHLIVAAAMLLAALAITLGMASFLQGFATARASTSAEPFTIEAIDPTITSFGTRERVGQTHQPVRAESLTAGG